MKAASVIVWLICFSVSAFFISQAEAVPLDGSGGGIMTFNSERDGNLEVYAMNADGSGQINITNNPANDGFGVWSPDGQKLAFVSNRDGDFGIYIMRVTNLRNAEFGSPVKISDRRPSSRVSWSPDGSQIIFDDWPECDIYRINSDGTGETQLTSTVEHEFQPQYSPDGTKIVFCLNVNGIRNICIMDVDGTNRRMVTDDGGSFFPSWSPDGSRVAFNSHRPGDIYADLCVTDTTGENRVWLTSYYALDEFPSWSTDGTRIAYQSDRNPPQIFIVNADGTGNTQITDNSTYHNGEPNWRFSGNFARILEGPHVNDGKGSSGVCWVDYDGDNDLDLYVTANATTGPANNSLYSNNGDGTYNQLTGLTIVNDYSRSSGAAWGDYDNDGLLDLCVLTVTDNHNILFHNDGDGDFSEVTNTPVDDDITLSSTLSWIDFDLDNNLDLYIGNSTNTGSYSPYRDFLFQGDGSELAEITEGDIVTLAKHTYGASWADYDNDGYPDLVVSGNLDEYTSLYHNEGDGSFTYVSSSDVCQSIAKGAGSSWADYDNDGDLDLFIGNSVAGPAYLYQNDGEGNLLEVTGHGLGMSFGRAYGGAWADYDNDGDLDILVWSNIYTYEEPRYDSVLGILFENINGTFQQPSDTLVLFGDRIMRTAVWGDSDRDGDLDLFAAMALVWSGSADNVFYSNDGNSNGWITVKPIGTASNHFAVGARVRLKADIGGSPVWQMRELTTQTRTCTQPPLEAHFGLGDAAIIDSIIVEWPSGMVDVLTDTEINQYLTITESLCGDANGDDECNVGDAVYLINYVFKGGPGPDPAKAGDANLDGECNVGDAVYLISYVFRGGAAPCDKDE